MGRTGRVVVVGLLVALAACRSPRGGGAKPGKGKVEPEAPVSSEPKPKAPLPTPEATVAPKPGIPTPSGSTFSRDPGGETVYDRARDMTWLADGNLPAKLPLGVKGVNPSGSMDYKTALKWVAALNAYEGKGYLGRSDWALPTTPSKDPACSSKNRHSFGFGCKKSMFAELYANAIGLTYPRTAVPIPVTKVRGFSGFQPYLYASSGESVGQPGRLG